MKIITKVISIPAKINKIDKQLFQDVNSQILKMKFHIFCEMEKDDYEVFKKLNRYAISFDEDLVPFGIPEYITPFDAEIIYLSSSYDGLKYNVEIHVLQI